MPGFVNGTVVTLVLDEFDAITMDGQANLTISPIGHPTYQTQTIGHQVIGPFGIVTTVVLTGAGAGTYVAGPSNQPQHALIVDISAAQQAAPTSDMLAATATLYQLNAVPYTIYQSNGTALVALGGTGGGVSTYAALTDKATVDLVATNPLLAASIAAVGAPAQSISYSTTIPLDTAGNGKYMPQTVLNANSTFTVGGSPVEQGNCNLSLLGNGTNIPNLAAFINANGYAYNSTAGANNIYFFLYTYGTPLLYGQVGSAVVTVPGQVTGLTAGSSSGTNQVLTWTAPATGGAPTDYKVEWGIHSSGVWNVFSHTVSTLTTQTVTGLSINTSYDFRVSATNSAGAGTVSSTLNATTLALPGQPTALTLGTATSSTQPLSWTAPGSGGAVANYLMEYRTTAGPGVWTSGGSVTGVSGTVSGLAAATSYDYRVTAVNAAGSGTPSATQTGSTGLASAGDTFDRGNSATSLGTASDGAAWTTADSFWGISTNKAYNPCAAGSGPGGSAQAYRNGTGSSTYTVSVDIDIPASGSEDGGLMFRVVDNNNFWFVQWQVSTTAVLVYKVVGGAFTGSTGSAGGVFTPGTTINLSVSTSPGVSSVVKINGSTVCTVGIDSTLDTATKVGLYVNAPSATPLARWNNLTVV